MFRHLNMANLGVLCLGAMIRMAASSSLRKGHGFSHLNGDVHPVAQMSGLERYNVTDWIKQMGQTSAHAKYNYTWRFGHQISPNRQTKSDETIVADVVAPENASLPGAVNLCVNGHFAPEFFLIGAQKAATTSLNFELFSTGAVICPAIVDRTKEDFFYTKEPHLFDEPLRYGLGVDFWLSHYPLCDRTRRLVALDSTPNYLYHAGTSERIMSRYGQTASYLKFLVLLREPVGRMQSAYYQGRDVGWWRGLPNTFKEYVEHVVEAPAGNLSMDELFQGSLYMDNLKRYFTTFGASSFTIVPWKFQVSPQEDETVAEYVLNMLGIDADTQRGAHKNKGTHPSLDEDLGADLQQRLRAKIEPDAGAAALAELFASYSPNLFHYPDELEDQTAIADWLTSNW